ncbi:MAG: hypothetical protein J6A01_00035 [Proteobacteria bacterium]|nr:hypothetical protein [Pseudomonadota bacterium]
MRRERYNPQKHYFLALMTAFILAGCSDDSGTSNISCDPGFAICGSACCSDTCCNGICVDTNNNSNHCGQCGNACESGKSCVSSNCLSSEEQCSPSQTWCDGQCVNTSSDSKHCGDCTTRCDKKEVCIDKECKAECAANYKLIDGACRNPMVDNEYCGDPAVACGDNMYCSQGTCKCQKAYYDCDEDAANGCESNLPCNAGKCKDPQMLCDDQCIDPMTDAAHCGDCETACEPEETCQSGSCQPVTDPPAECDPPCEPGETCQSGTCQPETEPPAECDPPCQPGETCQSGTCQPETEPPAECETGLEACFGRCVDLKSDREHCGKCLNACDEDENCIDGKCTIHCDGLTLCGGACIDTQNNAAHCGSCNKACLDGQSCVGGACQCATGRFDCDGNAANGCESETKCACTPGKTQACWRGDASAKFKSTDNPKTICEKGTQTCDATGQFWGPCTGGVYPSAITCDLKGNLNGLDNDCDGVVDTECRSECDLKAGDMSYIGCEYWSVYLYNLIADSTSNQTVVFSNPSDTDTATIYIYDKAGFEASTQAAKHTVTLAPKGVQLVQINKASSNMCVSTGILNNAYRIRSTHPITAYQFNPWDNPDAHSNDASLLLPANVLGKDYIVMTWHSEPGSGTKEKDHTSYFTVVATEPGKTKVTITTSSDIVKNASGTVSISAMTKGEKRDFTLDRFGVLTLDAPPARTHDQTGTIVHADKKIAVFGASRSTFVPNESAKCCRDHIEEQLLPTQAWGKSYYAVQAYTTGTAGDFWRILARDKDTKITIKGSEKDDGTITLNAGESYPKMPDKYFESRGGFEVTANKPIVLGQFLPSQQYNGLSIGDPSFILTVPYEQYRSDYAFMVPDKFDVNYITVIAPKTAKVTLDGKAVTYIKTGNIGSSNFIYGYIQMNGGVHRMQADKPFGLYGYGYFNMSSYGYPIGMDLKILNTN